MACWHGMVMIGKQHDSGPLPHILYLPSLSTSILYVCYVCLSLSLYLSLLFLFGFLCAIPHLPCHYSPHLPVLLFYLPTTHPLLLYVFPSFPFSIFVRFLSFCAFWAFCLLRGIVILFAQLPFSSHYIHISLYQFPF